MSMTIGELAGRAGVGVETVRYYERRGLLAEPDRGPNGYRLYTPADLERLAFIARAKRLGFTLTEIADLSASPAEVLDRAEAKLSEIEARRAELDAMTARLQALVDGCARGDLGCVAIDVPAAGPPV